MAELGQAPAASSCCSAAEQRSCCDPADKQQCCSPESGTCGCSAGKVSAEDVREQVRARYAAAARSAAGRAPTACCRLPTSDQHGSEVFGAALYAERDHAGAGDALAASLGCGVPTTVAELDEGEIVLDLGSGAGADVLISARRVGATGKAIGLDMTDEMLELARRNAEQAGVENVDFLKGYIEQIPLPDASVDVVISNCVLNLSADKPRAIAEAARVLRPGGRFAISDVIAEPDMDSETRADMQKWTGCIAGALTRGEFQQALADAGLVDVEIRETHRVHEHASAAIIRARKPAGESGRSVTEAIPLPMLCSLDDDALLAQRDRYRRIGAHAGQLERTPRRLVLKVDTDADDALIENAVTVERTCCPFFSLRWQPETRTLAISVSSAEHETALAAIVTALAL